MNPGELEDRVEHGYADSDGVRIHYAALGEGPLVVMGAHDAAQAVMDTVVTWLRAHRPVHSGPRGS